LARAWRCCNAEVEMLRTVIGAYPRAARLAQQERLTRPAIYRYYLEAGERGVDAGVLALAVERLGGVNVRWRRQAAQMARLWEAFYCEHERIVNPPPLLSGRDLLELGMAPGPEMGELLASLQEEQAAGEIESRSQALEAARAWLDAAREGGA
jgi:hypothetical protein